MSQHKQPEPPKPNIFEETVKEVRTGPFSILSEKAQDRIINMVRLALEDGYIRGFDAGCDKESMEAAEDAAGARRKKEAAEVVQVRADSNFRTPPFGTES